MFHHRAEDAAINKAISKLGTIRRAASMFPWALSTAAPATRNKVLRQLPVPARVRYRLVWLPRYNRKHAGLRPE